MENIFSIPTLKKIIRIIFIFYMCCIILIAAFNGNQLHFKFFLINSLSSYILAWFLCELNIIFQNDNCAPMLALSLFFLVSPILVLVVGDDIETSSLISFFLYLLAMLLIIILFLKNINNCLNKCKESIKLAHTDDLTGLPNRRYLNIILNEMENRCGTVFIADIDDFKKINDTYGHDVGDKVLSDTGSNLRKLLGRDVFIARTGGDEFVGVIFDNTSSEEIIQKVKSATSTSLVGNINVNFTIGVVTKKKHEPFTIILKKADHVLYKQKTKNKKQKIMIPIKILPQ